MEEDINVPTTNSVLNIDYELIITNLAPMQNIDVSDKLEVDRICAEVVHCSKERTQEEYNEQ
jgi:hypothetical protein